MISGILSGMVVLGPTEQGPFTPVTFWPREFQEPKKLAKVTERALKERKGVVMRDDTDEETISSEKLCFHIAYPVRAAGRLYGAAVLEITPRAQEQLQSVMRQLQWGVAWLENWVLRKEVERDARVKQRITTALDLAAITLQEDRFQAAATSFATVLATRLECDRVSIGFLKGKRVKVQALSHSAQFKKQMNLVRSIGAAMDESIEQQLALVYPDTSEESNRVLRAHAELAGQHGDSAVCTVPFLGRDGRGYGALTLERSADKPFEPVVVDLCDSVAALVAPILEEKRKNDRLLIKKIGETARLQLEKLIGPGHMAVKLAVAALLILVVFFSFAKGDYRVTAKTTIEGAVQRAVVAPYDGYIYEAPVRAGDTVREGQVMASLDNRDLQIERLKWASQREQYLRQYREAMAEGKRANMKILKEQVNQAGAQLALLEEQLSRTKMLAPFTGVVVSGDLSQSLGAPVERGKVLFEVAPLQTYRVKLQVDEREVSQMKVGQRGDLVFNALPETYFPITVEKITPVSTAKEGQNYFLVEARLEQVSERLRPGLEGFGKVTVERRKLIWIWTHKLLDWVRLWVWSWWP
jgi:RND family efflux transporter MFP subunit